jgi:hypothetical protein
MTARANGGENVMLDREHKRQLRAERHKRTRLRRKLGVVCVGVEVNADVIDFLVRNAWLRDGTTDARVIGDAITRMLQETSRAAAR